jgi:membrane-associated phospholipid phosphatase
MRYPGATAGGSGSAGRKPRSGAGERLIQKNLRKLAVALLLVSFNCLPARGQDAGNLVSWRAGEAPGAHLDRNVCILPRRELCSAPTFTDPKSTQKQSSDGAFKKVVRRFGKDQKEIYSAPFRGPNLKWDALFLGGTGILLATDRQASRAMPGNQVDISRNISSAGLYGTSAAAGILWFTGLATHNDHEREAGALSAEALANAAPVYLGLQLLTGRERPIEGTGNGRFGRNNALNSSFPSGHALFTWSMASVIAHEYPRPWVKWLAYGTATAVSLARFTGREHFPSDVAVGSLFGYLIGRHIFNAHCKEGLSESCRPRKITVAD